MAQTLLDQKDSGKMLLLITNSDYQYTERMMSYAYDRFLPEGMKWRDLFDTVRGRVVAGGVGRQELLRGASGAFSCRGQLGDEMARG